MNVTTICTGCGQTKLICEFKGIGTTKQYRTCNNCRTKNAKQKKNIKKRSYEDMESLEAENDINSLEVVEVVDFFNYITQLLSIHATQTENKENIPPFHFECKVDISTLNSSAKEVADFLIEFIEEADGFSWMYVYSINIELD